VLKYFTLAELSCTCNRPDCTASVDANAARALDELREVFGEPLVVTSGARCPGHNKAVGGEPGSWHLEGKAFDLHSPDGVHMRRLVRTAFDLGWTIGIKKRMVHVDRRPAPPLMFGY
jgi:uncharacterized protein YcbK (DUF882 family)